MKYQNPALTPDILIQAYAAGMFPMAVPEMGNEIFWFAPDPRTVIPLDTFHASRSLCRTVRQGKFDVHTDRDFEGVIRACAEPRTDDGETWISEEIIEVYTTLHRMGHAHSVECYCDNKLVGGVYGVALGGAFFGESMFHRMRDASKVALYSLVAHLKQLSFALLDVQYTTDHLLRFGAQEISRDEYERQLTGALLIKTHWGSPGQITENII